MHGRVQDMRQGPVKLFHISDIHFGLEDRQALAWVEDCIVMVRKHPHVYADVSGVLLRPWMAYNFLRLATEWGILDKLLFGSDYPFVMTPQETIDRLRGINDILEGTKLPRVPEDAIEEIIHRDSLAMLGLE